MIRINLIPVRQVQKRTLGQQQLILFALALLGGVLANVYWTNDADKTRSTERRAASPSWKVTSSNSRR